jgi:hypothetical protein
VATKKRILGPDQPAQFEDADVYAVQALFTGTANDGQQKRAVKWILEEACKVKDLPWVAGGLEGQRATDFANGRKFAGHQILKMIELRLNPKTSGGR